MRRETRLLFRCPSKLPSRRCHPRLPHQPRPPLNRRPWLQRLHRRRHLPCLLPRRRRQPGQALRLRRSLPPRLECRQSRRHYLVKAKRFPSPLRPLSPPIRQVRNQGQPQLLPVRRWSSWMQTCRASRGSTLSARNRARPAGWRKRTSSPSNRPLLPLHACSLPAQGKPRV
jgi:hypothetical protein